MRLPDGDEAGRVIGVS